MDGKELRNAKENFIQRHQDKNFNVYIENNPFEEPESIQDVKNLRNAKKSIISSPFRQELQYRY